MSVTGTFRLGDLLVQKGILTADQLQRALKLQKGKGGILGAVIVSLGFATEEQILAVLSEQLGIGYVRLKEVPISPGLIKRIPAKTVCHYRCFPVALEGDQLQVAISDPLNVHALDELGLHLQCRIVPVLASGSDIISAIQEHYGIGADTIAKLREGESVEVERVTLEEIKTEDIQEMAEDASIIKFVNEVFLEAHRLQATDIHIEPFEDYLRIRYRLDGILQEAVVPPHLKQYQFAIVSRIKIMANLNIAERRLPQDGRIKLKVGGENLDMRVSILATSYGETVNIRLLYSAMLANLEQLGFEDWHLKQMETLLDKPHGIIFVTGPTGSGKTTTLYACLNHVNRLETKIITIEDPIEYPLKGISQLEVQPKIGFTFATGLRSILRHDPDIIMVGEVRDFETAEIAIRSALTGHMVLSTLHTNDAVSSMTRLIDMKIEPFLITSTVQCIIAQRLVRRLCLHCRVPLEDPESALRKLGISIPPAPLLFEGGKGCDRCRKAGYSGRIAIYEFLAMDDVIRQLVMKGALLNKIKQYAQSKGMQMLLESGVAKALHGITSLSEVLRVTQRD